MNELARLTAVEELRCLKARFCRVADAKRWSEFGRLFTSNGQARFYDADGALAFFVDSPEIGAVIGRRIGIAQPIHHVFSHELTILSSARAEGVWAMEELVVYPEGTDAPFRRMHGFGHYHETYEHHEDRWLIRSLEVTRLRVDLT